MKRKIADVRLGRVRRAFLLSLLAVVTLAWLPSTECRAAEGTPVTMTYSYSNLFDGSLSRATGFTTYEMLLAVEEGLSLWSQVVPLTFVEQVDSGPPVSDTQYTSLSDPQIRIGHHGMSGNVLAHAYYPGLGGLSSDLHFDSSDRIWTESMFLTTATHELGHTIGLDHIDGVTSIMNSAIGGAIIFDGLGSGRLYEPEINAAQAIWGSGSGEVITQRVWNSSGSTDWIAHENWDRGWRPTKNSDTTIQTDAQVQLAAASQVIRSLTMAGGQNELQIGDRGSLTIRHDATMGTATGGYLMMAGGAPARVLVPTDDQWESTWFATDFDDHDWIEGPTGIGFDRSTDFDPLIETDVEGLMYGGNTSVYTRIEFEVDDPGQLAFLNLDIQYDDGFAAYLNGTRVAEANSPSLLRWNSTSTVTRDDGAAVQPEQFDLTAFIPLLQPGTNVLAIQGLNQRSSSSDLLLRPVLLGDEINNTLHLDGGTLRIEGNLHLAKEPNTRSLLRMDDGVLEVAGQITSGLGRSVLESHGGVLRMTRPPDTAGPGEENTLVVDQVDFYGGTIEGVATIQADFLHHAGQLAPSPEHDQLRIAGDYRMNEDAILQLPLPLVSADSVTPLQISGLAQLGGTLTILSDVPATGDEGIPAGELQSVQLISASLLEGTFDGLNWGQLPFVPGHQAAGLFRFLDYRADSIRLLTCQALPGDATGDCQFNSEDMVRVFQVGQYEDDIELNSDWTQGDWNGDQEFTADDLIAAFQTGLYEQRTGAASVAAVAEPSGGALLIAGLLATGCGWRKPRKKRSMSGRGRQPAEGMEQ